MYVVYRLCIVRNMNNRQEMLFVVLVVCFFFFFKQMTAYEMLRSLVGSEMLIRDRVERPEVHQHRAAGVGDVGDVDAAVGAAGQPPCLLYTSDAADDLLCVDLGRRRILK